MESVYFNFYDVLSLFGGFLSLLLGCILVFNERFRNKSNIALAICLFSLSLVIFRNILSMIEFSKMESGNYDSFIFYTPLFYVLFIPIGLYFNINYLLNPDYQLRRRDYYLIVPVLLISIVDLILLSAYLCYPISVKAYSNVLDWYGNIFINLVFVTYFLIVFKYNWEKITTYQSSLLNNFSSIEGKDLQWIKNSMKISLFIIFLFISTEIYTQFFSIDSPTIYYIFWMFLTCFICLIGFKFIINQNFYLVPHFQEKIEDKVQIKVLSEKTEEHYQYLLQLMQIEKLYHDSELNMDMLAEKMKLSKGYISRIINQKEKKNFYDFINTFRVAEVKEHLNHPNYAHYSILGIGLAAGFKSKSTFNTVFKKMTNMTPSSYKKQLK